MAGLMQRASLSSSMTSLSPPLEEFAYAELVADATTGLFWIQGIKEGSPAEQSWLTARTL